MIKIKFINVVVDQNQIFEMAKEKAKSMNKDLLLIYGYDNCC